MNRLKSTAGILAATLISSIAALSAPSFALAQCRQSGTSPSLAAAIELSRISSAFDDADAWDLDGMGLDHDLSPEKLARLAPDRRAYCGRSPQRISTLNFDNTIAFANPPGRHGIGLCWWMSRFQRSAAYVANFFPGRAKPDAKSAARIIDAIIKGDRVVEIPGYATTSDFTRDHEQEITEALSNWQEFDVQNPIPSVDAFFRHGSESPAELESRMKTIYSRYFRHPGLIVAKIAMKGEPFSHSILISNIEPLRTGAGQGAAVPTGFKITFNDPNLPQSPKLVTEYHVGDTKLLYPFPFEQIHPGGFLPMPSYEDELPKHEAAIRSYCSVPKATVK